MLLDAGPADVRQDVELLDHAADDGLADQLLGEGELDPVLLHEPAGPSAWLRLPRAEALEVEGDVAVAGGLDGGDDLVPAGDGAGQVVGVELDAGQVAVVADPQLAEAEPAQRRLGPGDRAQRGRASPASRRARGRPGRRRPACPRSAARAAATAGADVGLGEPGVDEGETGAPLGRRPLAGAVIAEVVEVDAEHDGRAARCAATGPRRVHQLGLAVVAALAVVGDVGRVGQLVGVDSPIQRRPHSAARARQSASSDGASDGDTAVAASTRSGPRVSWATQARKAESAPPLNATTTRPSSAQPAAQDASRSAIGIDDLEADPLVALALRLGLDHPDAPDLVGGADMGAAVGLLVQADDVDDPDLARPSRGSC